MSIMTNSLPSRLYGCDRKTERWLGLLIRTKGEEALTEELIKEASLSSLAGFFEFVFSI